MMRLDEIDYKLPRELIAQSPLNRRDQSRLMVLDRISQDITHDSFSNIVNYLQPGDVLVCNDTRVIPARLYARKPTGGKVEVLLLRKEGPEIWSCLIKPASRLKLGLVLDFGQFFGAIENSLSDGVFLIRFFSTAGDLDSSIEGVGILPLPPYITQPLKDPERYQTVYARYRGAVASPTAGLHFTDELLEQIRLRGVEIEFITLHIGLDTFRPIQEDAVENHKMFSEYYSIPISAAERITKAKLEGRRVVSVGTTTTRALESSARIVDGQFYLEPGSSYADLFVLPGYSFKVVDALITNFHLPKSTLILLVGAFTGLEFLLSSYSEAIENRYRFYSFGDAMFIL